MSPIKGVSEIVRLPRLGKIRLGIKKETEAGMFYPTPTDYFVCPVEVRKVFGEKPRELRIMFPTDDERQWASQYLRCYSASRGLICRGDGETALARVDRRTGEIATREATGTELRETTCSPDSCGYYQRKQCRRVMNLQFLLPDCPGFGVYQLDTSSYHSILNINSMLEFIRSICGRVSIIPLYLKLAKLEVEPEGIEKTVHVLNLVAPYTFIEIQKYARMAPGQAFLLPAPDSEAPDDLFPDAVLEPEPEASGTDTELIWAWAKAKSKIWQLDIQDSQIANWFWNTYRLHIRLADFDSAIPPRKLNVEHLIRFCRAVEQFETFS
jgi:hypothetical protein